jgi:hypothetical protein
MNITLPVQLLCRQALKQAPGRRSTVNKQAYFVVSTIAALA